MDNIELENRLIKFAVMVNGIIESLPETYMAKNLAKQMSRSGMSPFLNYAEAQSAESRRDFIHKMKVSLKELKETSAGLKFTKAANLIKSHKKLEEVLSENTELIAIFIKSIDTATKNDQRNKGKDKNYGQNEKE